MSWEEESLSMLRACLVSSKGGVSLQNLKRDYRSLTGEYIPYQRFGFSTLEDFLSSRPDIVITRDNQGEWVVKAKASENTAHLQKMIEKQKTKPKRAAPSSRYNYYASNNVRRLNTNSRYRYAKPSVHTQNVTRPVTQGRSITNGLISKPRSVTNGLTQARSITNGLSQYQTNKNDQSQPRSTMNVPLSQPKGTKGFKKEVLQFYVPPHQRSKNQEEGASPSPPPQPPRESVSEQPQGNSLPLKVELRNTGDGNWARWVKPQHSAEHSSHRPDSPPLPPSPPSPLTPQAAPVLTTNIDKAVYPPEAPKSTIPEPQKSSPVIKSNNDNQAESEKNNPPLRSATYKPATFCHKLVQYTREHALEQPVFKTAPIQDLNQVKYICSVKVGSQQVSDSTSREESRTMAEERAARLMLQKLSSLTLSQAPQNSLPVTSDEQLATTRVMKLMQEHPHGLWASEVGAEYSKLHSERLPDNWLFLVEDNDQYEVIRWNESKILVQLAEDVKLAPLVPPPEKYWDVQVIYVVSAAELWLRIIGPGFSDCLFQLSEEITKAREKLKFGLKQVHAGRYVLVLQEDEVHRAEVLRWNKESPTAECRLLDAGVTENIPLSNMARLPQKFARLPAQAVKCRLQNLSGFCDSSVTELLVRELCDETRIASVCSVEGDCRVVEIFDTSTENDVNMNLVLLNLILNDLYAPTMPQAMDVSEVIISHVADSCEVYVQPNVATLHWMEDQIIAERAEIDKQTVLAYLDTSEMYLAVWPDVGYQKAQGASSTSNEEVGKLARVEIKNRRARLVCARPLTEVFYVDYGWTTNVVTSLLKKFTPTIKDLSKIPHQAVLCKLRGVPPKPNLVAKPSAVLRLSELLPLGSSPALRTTQPATDTSPPIVELFIRTQPSNIVCSVCDTIAMDLALFHEEENYPEDPS